MHSRAADRRSASKCQGKWPDQTLDQAFGLPRGAGSGQHLASVLQEGRENANIDAGLGFIWSISAEPTGFACKSSESGTATGSTSATARRHWCWRTPATQNSSISGPRSLTSNTTIIIPRWDSIRRAASSTLFERNELH